MITIVGLGIAAILIVVERRLSKIEKNMKNVNVAVSETLEGIKSVEDLDKRARMEIAKKLGNLRVITIPVEKYHE